MLAKRNLPFVPVTPVQRRYSVEQCLHVFMRDGCIDRYSGRRLVLPGVLRLLSAILPEELPYHPNWKTTACHSIYWHVFPTLDHVVPVARGGTDSEDNLVTTSMLRNAAKGLWTLEELGWRLMPPGDRSTWDGMIGWLIDYVALHPEHLAVSEIRRWHRAASRVQPAPME